MSEEKIILGIDPGTTITGYGVIKKQNGDPMLIAVGIIDLRKLEDHYVKLKKIFERTLGLIEEYHPDELAIEAPFYGKNVQSMLKLGRAQGVAMAAALYRDIPIFEYAPRKIKMAITGQGSASKEQVAAILKSILKTKDLPENLDATDGLAAAVCHCYQKSPSSAGKGYSGWKDFVNKNSDRTNK